MTSAPLVLCLCTWEKAILKALLQGSPWSSPSIYSKGLFFCCQFSYSSHTLAPSAYLIWSKFILTSEGMFMLWELQSGCRDALTLSPTNINASYTFHSHLLTPSWGYRNFPREEFCFILFLYGSLLDSSPLSPVSIISTVSNTLGSLLQLFTRDFLWDCEVKWKSLSCVWLFVTPWTVQSMRLSRPEYWSGQPFPSIDDLPNPGIKLSSPALQVDSLPAELHIIIFCFFD